MDNPKNQSKSNPIQTDFVAVYQNILKQYNEEHEKLTKMLAEIEVMKRDMPLPKDTPEQIEKINKTINDLATAVFRSNGLPDTLEEIEMLPQKLLINSTVQVKRHIKDATIKQNKETRELKRQQRKV